MDRALVETVCSGLFAFAAGAALWPPRRVYWTIVAEHVGAGATMATVVVLGLVLGTAFGVVFDVGVRNFAVGTVAAYAVGMVAIEVFLEPLSPVHLVLYAGILAALAGGVGAAAQFGDGIDTGPFPVR